MKLTRYGVEVKVLNDTLTWLWPWAKSKGVRSSLYQTDFKCLLEYVEHCVVSGMTKRDSGVLESASTVEVVSTYVQTRKMHGYVVCLTNVNAQAQPPSFWGKLRADRAYHFNNDVVFLMVGSRQQALDLVRSLPVGFADFCVLLDGVPVTSGRSGECT